MTKIDNDLFSAHEHALEKEFGVCPECGSELVIRHSKSGPFVGCASYPNCEYTKSLIEHDVEQVKVLDGSHCPLCSEELAVKNGRYGMFIGCTGFPDCHYIAHDNDESVEDKLPQCPKCSAGQLVKRSNKSGRTFYSCNAYPDCNYILNQLPIDQACPQCGWSVLIAKSTASGNKLQCPQKLCGYKQKD